MQVGHGEAGGQGVIPRSPTDKWVADRLGIPLEDLSCEKLEAYQIDRLKETLRYAKKNGRIYAELYKSIDVDSICTMSDIAALPCLSERDLAENEWRFQCISPAEVSRVVSVPTTGTSGRIKHIAFSENDQKSAMEFILTGFRTMCAPGDRMLIMMSGETPGSIGAVVKAAVSELNIEVETCGAVADIAESYEKLISYRPNIVVGIPHQTAALVRYGERLGNPEKEYIKAVLLSADDIPESICTRIADKWQCSTFRHYGMTEMCIAGGVECFGHDGYHLRACDILFETVDEDDNGFGEIVISTLGREAMPLIRYRTGDIGRITHKCCPCGSVLPRIETIRGRKNNRVSVNGRELFLSDISNAVFAQSSVIDFRCLESEIGEVSVEILSLPDDKADENEIKARLGNVTVKRSECTGFSTEYNLKKRVERV